MTVLKTLIQGGARLGLAFEVVLNAALQEAIDSFAAYGRQAAGFVPLAV
jgi:hypothetical protein